MRYRIVCTNQEPVGVSHDHAHIVAVGTGDDPNRATTRWTVEEVLDAMRRGDVFYTEGERSGRIAKVEPYVCARCRRTYIRSTPDAVSDNNLDNLRVCVWQRTSAR